MYYYDPCHCDLLYLSTVNDLPSTGVGLVEIAFIDSNLVVMYTKLLDN